MEANDVALSHACTPSCPTPVEVTREGTFGKVRNCGLCTRRTEHGFEADLPGVLSVGEEVEAELCLPEMPEPLRASARVIYRNQNHYGFFFRSSSNSQRGQRHVNANAGSRMIQ